MSLNREIKRKVKKSLLLSPLVLFGAFLEQFQYFYFYTYLHVHYYLVDSVIRLKLIALELYCVVAYLLSQERWISLNLL